VTSATFDVVMKHSMSSLADLAVHVEVDKQARLVTLGVNAIDSTLLLDLVTRMLPQDHDVVAFTDDGAVRTPPAPPFSLRIHFDGRYLRAHASRLITGTLALRLETATAERMRMALESAPRVLQALREAGFKAIVGGSVGRGEKGHPDSDLDVFVFGTFEGFSAGQVAAIADSVSTVPVDVQFEHWIANVDPANFLMRRHLVLHPGTGECLAVPGTLGARR
jgi:predicted nucleotidyltransferase